MPPHLRPPDEHPLKLSAFTLARRYFDSVEIRAFHLLSLTAVPFRRSAGFPRLVAILDRIDATLFRWLPFTMRYAWYAVAVMGGRRPAVATAPPKSRAGD